MSTTIDERHLTDAELIQILDRTHGDDDADRLEEHLQACDRCTTALDGLREDSLLISSLLQAADFEDGGREPRGIGEPVHYDRDGAGDPAPTARLEAVPRSARRPRPSAGAQALWRSPWLKAAAILVLIAAPVAAIPGVRAWVGEQLGGATAAVESTEQTTPPTVIRFTPDAGDFAVTFEPGSTGSISVERSDGPQAELRLAGADAEAVVSASSVVIRNSERGRHALYLPANVTGIWVRIGERAVAVSDEQIDRRTVVELGR